MIRPQLSTLSRCALIAAAGACSATSDMPTPTPAEAMPVSEAPMGSAPEDDSPLAPNAVVSFEADNPFIQYSGRVSFADPKRPEFSAPGVYITARFRGSAVAVLLEHAGGGKAHTGGTPSRPCACRGAHEELASWCKGTCISAARRDAHRA